MAEGRKGGRGFAKLCRLVRCGCALLLSAVSMNGLFFCARSWSDHVAYPFLFVVLSHSKRPLAHWLSKHA